MASKSFEVVVYTPGDFEDQPELCKRFTDVLEEARRLAPKFFREFPGVDVTVIET